MVMETHARDVQLRNNAVASNTNNPAVRIKRDIRCAETIKSFYNSPLAKRRNGEVRSSAMRATSFTWNRTPVLCDDSLTVGGYLEKF